MKTHINNTQGVVTYKLGDKIILESTAGIEINGDLTIAGTTTTNARVDDRIIELAYGSTGSASSNYDAGIVINRGDDDNVFFGWDESVDLFKVATGTFTGTSTENLSLTLGGMQSLSLTSNSLTGSNTITTPAGGLIIGSTAVSSTAAELNLLDGSAKSTSSITVADSDAILIIDGTTTKQIPASDLKTYVGSSAGGTSLANLDIDGGTDIGAALVDADLIIVDDGAGGTNRKSAMSRVKTYVSDLTLTTAAQTAITSLGTLSALAVSGDLTIDTSTLKVDSTNNRVGIGTAAPGGALDVVKDISDVERQIIVSEGHADTTAAGFFGYHDTGNTSTFIGNRYSSDDATFSIRMKGSAATNDVVTVLGSGDVGIGTTSPDSTLHVHAGSAGTVTANTYADDLVIENSDSCGISILSPADKACRIYFGDPDSNQRGYILYDHSTDLMKFSVANGNRLIVDSSGLVGIGNITPTEKLDVDGDAIRIRTSQTPATAGATGTAGMVCWDANYIYVCVATNTWKRVSLGTW